MKPLKLLMILLGFTILLFGAAPKDAIEIPLYEGTAPGSEDWTVAEFQGRMSLNNVSRPRLLAFKPKEGTGNGTAVIIAPGGAMMGLAVEIEGYQVAKWLSDRGFTAFVLIYRTLQIPLMEMEAASRELRQSGGDPNSRFTRHVPIAVADGVRGVELVRSLADEYGFFPDRIVNIGFSAGGRVAIGQALHSDPAGRPNYTAWIYTDIYERPLGTPLEIPADTPPVFMACAADDAMFWPRQIPLYQAVARAGVPVEMHLYEQGGHGFGMKHPGHTSDHWIDAFYWWLESRGLATNPIAPTQE